MSFYIGKLKVSLEKRAYFALGIQVYYPRAKMIDFNIGKRVLTFWYRT